MLLQSINAISISLLEVPTGAIADLIGRRFSLMMSSIMFIIGLTIYVLTHNFYAFIAAEIMFGLGLCFKSGADSALLYDSLKELGRTHEYAKIQGRAQSYALMTQTIGSIGIGYLYSMNVNLPYIISIFLLAISGATTFFFKEAGTYKGEAQPSYFNQIRKSAEYVINHQRVKGIIIYSTFIYVFWRIGFWYYQPYMKAVNIDTKHFGIIFAVFNLMAAISSWKANSIIKMAKDKSLILLSMLFAVSFLLMGITRSFLGVFLIIPQEMARGIRRPIILKYVNENIPSGKRATIISFKSLIENLAVAIAFPLIGMLIDSFDIIYLHIYTGLTMLLGIVGVFMYLKKNVGTFKAS